MAIDLRIIHFHPNTRMANRFVEPLIEAEREAGYHSQLVTSDQLLDRDNISIPFDLSVSNLVLLPAAIWRIWTYLKGVSPDLVICHNTKSALLPLLAAWLAGVNVRVYFNHGVPYVAYRGVLRYFLILIERWNMTLATQVLTVSTDMVELLQEVYPSRSKQIINHGSACGIDLDKFHEQIGVRTAWRNAHGLFDEDLVVLYVGRPEKRKGFEIVLSLAVTLIGERDIKFVLCGPSLDDVLKCINSKPPNVLTLGFVDNISEVMLCSDILLLPSFHEGLSYACLEGQASNLIVIANNIVGVKSVVSNEINGILINNNNLEKYSEIIQHINKNRDAFNHLKLEGRKNVGRFSRKKFIPVYLKFLSDLLLHNKN